MHNGFAIALAWPNTKCKQAGGWYDGLLRSLGVNQKGYYKVGHSALILVNDSDGSCYYFDFGRYHSPNGYGRVRSVKTDRDLAFKIKGEIADGVLLNTKQILEELQSKSTTHGDGHVCATTTRVNVKCCYAFALKMQLKEFIPYGPFVWNGTNCSRFVNAMIRSGSPQVFHKFKLKYPYSFSPTPIGNVKALNRKEIIVQSKVLLEKTCVLKTSVQVNDKKQWLTGEGGGSWFSIEKDFNPWHYRVIRSSFDGTIECDSIFHSPRLLHLHEEYEFIYPSNCEKITIMQRGEKLKMYEV
jgi:hypothetical protein